MHRKIIYWKLRDRELQLGDRTIVMGVLNITPDSFSDAGLYSDPEKAYVRALELEEQGADIIDIGAESTRPGAEPVSADEEWRRLVPLLKKLRGALSVPVSLDTYKSETAERALQYDVHILNDPSGLTFDPALAKIAATGNTGLILNHMRGRPEQWAKMGPMTDAIGTVTKELDATVSRARHAGVDRQRIVVDPGIGFGKRKEQNSELLAQLGHLAKLELPILVGVSRKSFLAQATEKETLFATAAGVTASILNGAHIVRVHDVKEMLSVVRVADEIAHAAMAELAPESQSDRSAAKRPAAKMPVWEEEKSKPTRPPMKKVEAPLAEAKAPLAEATAQRDKESAPQENQPAPELPQQRPERPFERREGSPPPRQFDRVPKLDRPARPFDKRPFERREENPYRKPDSRPGRQEDRPAAAGGREDRPVRTGGPGGAPGDRPFRKPAGDRPFVKPGGDRPFRKAGDRPFNKAGADRSFGKPGDRPFRKPGGDRPFTKPGDRPFSKPGDRPFRKPGDRPFSRPGGDRPSADRPQGTDRPQGRPPGDRPPFRGGPPRGGRPSGGPPRGDRPGGSRGPSGPRKPFRKD